MSLKRILLMMICLGIGAWLMLEAGYTKSYGQIAFHSHANGEIAISMLFAIIVCLAMGFFAGLTLQIVKIAINERLRVNSSWMLYAWSAIAGFLLMAFAMTMIGAWRTESTANASLLAIVALSAMYGTLYCAEFFDKKKSESDWKQSSNQDASR